MYNEQTLVTLITMQENDFHTIKVRFKHKDRGLSEKEYYYKAPSFMKVEVGDEVIVDSPYNGFVVVLVTAVDDFADITPENGHSYKWVVQRVDPVFYTVQKEREEIAAKQIRRARSKAAADRALQECRDALADSPEAVKEFNQAVESLKPPHKRAPQPVPPAPRQYSGPAPYKDPLGDI